MTKATRGILRPMLVPWQLTQAVTKFAVVFPGEADDDCIVSADANSIPDGDLTQGEKRVQITFCSTAHIEIMTAIGSRASMNLEDYDAGPMSDLDDDDDQYPELRDTIWRETGICPDPLAYEVEKSQLVEELRCPYDQPVEYLLVGDDWSVRVVALEYSWKWIR